MTRVNAIKTLLDHYQQFKRTQQLVKDLGDQPYSIDEVVKRIDIILTLNDAYTIINDDLWGKLSAGRSWCKTIPSHNLVKISNGNFYLFLTAKSPIITNITIDVRISETKD